MSPSPLLSHLCGGYRLLLAFVLLSSHLYISPADAYILHKRPQADSELNPGRDIDDLVAHERAREEHEASLLQKAHHLSEAGMGFRLTHPRLVQKLKKPLFVHHKNKQEDREELAPEENIVPPRKHAVEEEIVAESPPEVKKELKEQARDSLGAAPSHRHSGGMQEVIPFEEAPPPKTPHRPDAAAAEEEEKVVPAAAAEGDETPVVPARHMADPDNPHPLQNIASMADVYFLAVVAGCSVAGLVGLVVAGVCWYRLQKNLKAASEVEYPAYGIQGQTKERVQSPGDRKLAQSAQMYHYQHQKQQMIALEKANGEMKQEGSDEDSEEENEEGDYTVYECPGLAPTGEMEVKNPLFTEDTPVTPTAPATDK